MSPKLVLAGALIFVWEQKKVFAKALLLPFLLYLAIDLVINFSPASNWLLALSPISLAIHTIVAITTHRLILLGPESVPEWGIKSWTKRETFFLLHLVLVGSMIIPLALLQLIPILGGIAAIGIYCWLLGRVSLVFPGIAVDKGYTIPYSWAATENFQKEMVVIVILFPITIGLPTAILSLLPYTSILVSAVSLLLNVFTIAALSLAYREILRSANES